MMSGEGKIIRPWGWYLRTYQTEGYKTKVFSVEPGKRLSLQSHEHRKEMWSIIRGEGLCTIGDNVIKVKEDSLVSVPKGVKHRIENISDKCELIVSEVQIGDYLEEDDIVRYEDDYRR
ncbi:MAG: phosphomannose isomerase type II C-terminal cupin domain [Kiritimatiellae bacterium]|nr:phosphomannose isomerase type II C-terminal cupin domain [Kiritimatiellia bacterium]